MEDSRESIDEYLKNKIVERGGLQVRKSLLQGFTLSEIIDSMPCVSQQSKEHVLREEREHGPKSATCVFIDELLSSNINGWGYQFLDALHRNKAEALALKLCQDYKPQSNNRISNVDGHNISNNHLRQQSYKQAPPTPNQQVEMFSDLPPPYEEAVGNPDDFSISGGSLAAIDQQRKLEAYQSTVNRDQREDHNACQRKVVSPCTSAAPSSSKQSIVQSNQILSESRGNTSNFLDRNKQNCTNVFNQNSHITAVSSIDSTSVADSLDLAYRKLANTPPRECSLSTLQHENSCQRNKFATSLPAEAQNKSLAQPKSPKSTNNSIFCDSGEVASGCEVNVTIESDFDQGVALLSSTSNNNGCS